MGISFSTIVMLLVFALIIIAFILVLFSKSHHNYSEFSEHREEGAREKMMKMKHRNHAHQNSNDTHDPLLAQHGFYK